MLGVYGPGHTISAADLDRSLTALNDMIELAVERVDDVLCVAATELRAATQHHAIHLRHRRLDQHDPPAAGVRRRRVRLPARCEQQQIPDGRAGSARVQSAHHGGSEFQSAGICAFYDPQFPLGIVNIWPTPCQVYQCYFYSYLQLGDFPAPETNVLLPPGYNLAIRPIWRSHSSPISPPPSLIPSWSAARRNRRATSSATTTARSGRCSIRKSSPAGNRPITSEVTGTTSVLNGLTWRNPRSSAASPGRAQLRPAITRPTTCIWK